MYVCSMISPEELARIDQSIIDVLVELDGTVVKAILLDESVHLVLEIAWGYDWGDDFAHITTNCSPGREDLPLDLFFTKEIAVILDLEEQVTLWAPQSTK
jgi:hypothetical protein